MSTPTRAGSSRRSRSRSRRAQGARPIAEGACRADRHDAVGDCASRVGRPAAPHRHPAPHRRSPRLRADRGAASAHEERGDNLSTTLDVEDVQTTKGEKLLAVVLTIFLLIGGVWTYQKIDDVVRDTSPPDYSYRGTPAEQAAVARLQTADRKVQRAVRELGRARRISSCAARPTARLWTKDAATRSSDWPTSARRPGCYASSEKRRHGASAPWSKRSRPLTRRSGTSPRCSVGARRSASLSRSSSGLRSCSRRSFSASGCWRGCGGEASRYY